MLKRMVGRAHASAVMTRRIEQLARALAACMPCDAQVLDVGCGDGQVASRLMTLRPDVAVEGIDILIRPHTHIPVRQFDGNRIPYGDGAVDVVMAVDVVHHATDPAKLVREMGRVAGRAVVVKDHFRDGILAGPTLSFMDWVGNAPHGVQLPYNYLSRAQWNTAWDGAQLVLDCIDTELDLYPRPANWVFGRQLHFVARLRPARALAPSNPGTAPSGYAQLIDAELEVAT